MTTLKDYPPITAAGLATVVQLLIGSFFTTWSQDQVAAVGAAVFLLAAFFSTAFTRSKASLARESH